MDVILIDNWETDSSTNPYEIDFTVVIMKPTIVAI